MSRTSCWRPCRTSARGATSRASRTSGGRSPLTAAAARRPLRRRPQPQRVHARGRAAGARRHARRRRRACAIERIDMRAHEGAHPCIGALDVVPIVYLSEPRTATLARDEALAVANRLAGRARPAGVPVRRARQRPRAAGARLLPRRRRRGAGASACATASWRRTSARRRLHPTAGATLVAARPPLVAFNVELDTRRPRRRARDRGRGARARRRPAGRARDRHRSSRREGGCQVSTNVHDPFRVPAARRWSRRCGARPPQRGDAGALRRAGRPRARRRRSRAFPEDVADPRLRRAPPRARARARRHGIGTRTGAAMAQQQRRRRKHKGTAGGDRAPAPARPSRAAGARHRRAAPRASARTARRPGAARSRGARSRRRRSVLLLVADRAQRRSAARSRSRRWRRCSTCRPSTSSTRSLYRSARQAAGARATPQP